MKRIKEVDSCFQFKDNQYPIILNDIFRTLFCKLLICLIQFDLFEVIVEYQVTRVSGLNCFSFEYNQTAA